MVHKPSRLSADMDMVSTATSCGLTKGGRLLPLNDHETRSRVQGAAPETREFVDAVNDKLLEDMQALVCGEETDTLRFIDAGLVSLQTAVPAYYDKRFEEKFDRVLTEDPELKDFTSLTIGEMVEQG